MSLVNTKKLLIIATLLVFGFISPLFVSAQEANININFEVYPSHPQPNQNISVGLTSFSVDLDRAYIEWLVDGTMTLAGRGETRLSTQTGDLGEVTLIKTKIILSSGRVEEKTLAIQPASVDVLWEAVDSYVPPFYKGKALPAPGATIKAVAVPQIKKFNGVMYSPESLVYTWKRDLDIVQAASGFNKQFFTFRNGLFNNEEDIRIEVESQDGYSSAAESTNINLYQPEIRFYEEKSGEGVLFQKELTSNELTRDNRTTIVAAPFFFSKEGALNSINYRWQINDRIIATPKNRNKVTIQKNNEEGGLVNIKLTLESSRNLFQEASQLFKIKFN
jgi:hypothetical protein